MCECVIYIYILCFKIITGKRCQGKQLTKEMEINEKTFIVEKFANFRQ